MLLVGLVYLKDFILCLIIIFKTPCDGHNYDRNVLVIFDM